MIHLPSCAIVIAPRCGVPLLALAFMLMCICAKLGHGQDTAPKASSEVDAAQILMAHGWSLCWERTESGLHLTGVTKVGDIDRSDLPHLANCPFLRSIQLKYTYNSAPSRWPTLSREDLSFLRGAAHLESLALEGLYVHTPQLAESLRTSTRLRTLSVTISRLTDSTVIGLSQIPALEELAVIVVEKDSPAALRCLLRCDGLTSLTLLRNSQNCLPPWCFVSGKPTDRLILCDAAIGSIDRDFMGLRGLRRMVLVGCSAADANVSRALLSMEGLSELVIIGGSFPIGFRAKTPARNTLAIGSDLVSLEIDGSAALELAQLLPHLSVRRMSVVGVADIDPIRFPPTLESLHLQLIGGDDSLLFERLRSVRRLRSLSMMCFTDVDLGALVRLCNDTPMEEITLCHVSLLRTEKVPLPASGARRLRTMRFRYTDIAAESLRAFLTGAECEVLELRGECAIASDGLKTIPGLEQLQELVLAENSQISDSTVRLLPSMPSLEYLDLSETRITSESLRQIARYPRLHTVKLSGVKKITDEGIASMEKGSIRELDLSDTLVTAPTIARCPFDRIWSGAPKEDCHRDDDVRGWCRGPASSGVNER